MRQSRRPRVLLALSLTIASALGAYACDSGTFDNQLNVYHPAGPGTSSEDSSTPATPVDAQTDGGDSGRATDGGDGGSATDGGDAGDGGAQLDGADGSDAGTGLDAADGGG